MILIETFTIKIKPTCVFHWWCGQMFHKNLRGNFEVTVTLGKVFARHSSLPSPLFPLSVSLFGWRHTCRPALGLLGHISIETRKTHSAKATHTSLHCWIRGVALDAIQLKPRDYWICCVGVARVGFIVRIYGNGFLHSLHCVFVVIALGGFQGFLGGKSPIKPPISMICDCSNNNSAVDIVHVGLENFSIVGKKSWR